jgi:uncharacterized protein YciI
VSDETRYVLFYENGANFAAVREHFPAHRARWQSFMDRGVLLLVGPFTDGEGGALGLFTTREAAQEYASGDPFVLNAVVGNWHVREWRAVGPD